MSKLLFEMYAACGKNDDVELVLDDVLNNAKSHEDKVSLMTRKVCLLGSVCRYEDTVAYGFGAMKQLGENVTHKPNLLKVLFLLGKARRKLRRLSDDDVMKLPLATDEKVKALTRINTRVGIAAVMTHQDFLALFCMLRATCLSFDHGIATATPIAPRSHGVFPG